MKGVILDPITEQRLRSIAVSTKNTKRNQAPFRHLLLYGPPGTGKTLFAKALAKHSGLDYAIMTGGDIAPLGRDAVTEMHRVFDWADTSRKGVLLFIDESDAFLRRRATEHISEDMRNALNAFLYRTGESSHKFMVVYASNQPEQFDGAVSDRIDEMVEFALPTEPERLTMIAYYVDMLLSAPTDSQKIIIEGITEEMVHDVAHQTVGFSGREINKLAVAWQSAAYGVSPPIFTEQLMFEVLKTHIATKKLKMSWSQGEMTRHKALLAPSLARPAAAAAAAADDDVESRGDGGPQLSPA
eukprot:FR738244.1.p1 GENE.FR738244.1~~FR738244.1.p1  ORF type:complete len:299 (+),score=45.02 FR738244.1:2-898(+)